MTRQLFILTVALALSALTVFGQRDTIDVGGGLFMVKDSAAFSNEIGDCTWCNPEIMNDRTILDSNKTMIARKTSNHLGYTYYEWRSKKHSKTNEEIQFWKLNFKMEIYYSDSGSVIEERTKCFSPFTIIYSDNRWHTVEKIRIGLNQQTTDSLIKTYNLSKYKIISGQTTAMTYPNTNFWQEINFYENGKIKSMGTFITTSLEEIDNSKIGAWFYYNTKEVLDKKELYSAPKMRQLK